MQDPAQPESVDVFIGVDVGKGQHHAVALDRGGKRLLDRALPNSEAQLKALIKELRAHGTLLFVVDQPASIGALPIAVARAEGIAVAYLPGLAMRSISRHEQKTRDAGHGTRATGLRSLWSPSIPSATQ